MKLTYLYVVADPPVPTPALAKPDRAPRVRVVHVADLHDALRSIIEARLECGAPPSFYTDAGEAMLDALTRRRKALLPAPNVELVKKRLRALGAAWSFAHLAVIESWPRTPTRTRRTRS